MDKLKKFFPLSAKFSKSAGQTALCVAIYVVVAVVVSLFFAFPFSNILAWITLAIFVPLFFLAYIFVAVVIGLASLVFPVFAGNVGSVILMCIGIIVFFVLLVIFALLEMILSLVFVWIPIVAISAYCLIGLVLAIVLFNDSKKKLQNE